MSFRAEIMRKRLNRCEEIFRPPGSFAARVHALSPEHKLIYESWKLKCAEYWAQWDIDDVYRVIIGDICSIMPEPKLPFIVKNKLFPMPDLKLSPQEQYEQLLESL